MVVVIIIEAFRLGVRCILPSFDFRFEIFRTSTCLGVTIPSGRTLRVGAVWSASLIILLRRAADVFVRCLFGAVMSCKFYFFVALSELFPYDMSCKLDFFVALSELFPYDFSCDLSSDLSWLDAFAAIFAILVSFLFSFP